MSSTITITPESTMAEVEASAPGARRALFARYHIGGCQSCGFQPDETLAQVCARNDDIDVEEAIAHIESSHQHDISLQISPSDLKAKLDADAVKLIDLRTREEFEAVKIPGAQLFSQELQQEIFGHWEKDTEIALYDHSGDKSLDATAFIIGHGFTRVHALEGGIDAYSREVDPSLPRYRLELD
ncbi:MAG: rhodanese-like domain-containing protein [Verrucomicrobiales bacterium]